MPTLCVKMKTSSKVLGVIISVVIIGISIFVFIGMGLSADCKNTIIKTSNNPENKLVAILFERNCGATTGYSTQVSILRTGDDLSNEGGNVYIADGYPKHNGLFWLNNETLRISGAKNSTYKKLRTLKGVKIVYE